MSTRFNTILLATACAVLIAVPLGAGASSSAHVQQHISVSATSGGTTSTSGSVRTGGQHTEVFLETRVNGEVIERIEETLPHNPSGISIEQHLMAASQTSRVQDDRSSTIPASTDESEVLREIRLLLRNLADLLTSNHVSL